ncbi:MAG: RNA methyltransferase [Vicinamibacterales bacterium]
MRVDPDATDPRLDPYRHVGDPSWLKAQGLFVAEGRLVVERLIASRRYPVESILVTPAAFMAMEAAFASTDVEVLVCRPDALEQVTGFNFHRGCLALARRPTGPEDEGWIDRDQTILGLDAVGNPDNVGSLFRTAAALGAGGLVITAASADPLYRKAVRTSMGAVLQVPWVRVPTATDAMRRLRQHEYQIVALTPRADAILVDELAALRLRRVAVMLGSEGDGLSNAILDAADYCVRIPQAPGVDSLNVTVAAAIALHTLRAHPPR